MKCIDSRRLPNGYRRRRYLRPDGQQLVTIEVPMVVWTAINKQGRDHDRAAAHLRALSRSAVHAQALRHLREGWKAVASAHELGVPVRTVQRWRKEAPASTRVAFFPVCL